MENTSTLDQNSVLLNKRCRKCGVYNTTLGWDCKCCGGELEVAMLLSLEDNVILDRKLAETEKERRPRMSEKNECLFYADGEHFNESDSADMGLLEDGACVCCGGRFDQDGKLKPISPEPSYLDFCPKDGC